MMQMEEREAASQADEQMMVPGSTTSPEDPLTYDPTQGQGTSAWQEARRKQAELNEKLGLETNARFRRN